MQVEKLLRRGIPQVQIAKEVGVSPGQISLDCRAIRERWEEEYKLERRNMLMEKLAANEEIRAEAWAAWERSKEDAVKNVEEKIPIPEDENNGDEERTKRPRKRRMTAEESLIKIKEILTREGRLPANAYLATIMETHKADRELLGLDAAQKVDVVVAQVPWDQVFGPQGDPIEIVVDQLPAPKLPPKEVKDLNGESNGQRNGTGSV